ncbi:hypothetical protein WJX81_005110 [Elliptochloris bilobata]|uniref:MYND-type domain-containing protein n=1 Tax=Elliptochloris bilobata TaxID=381761 RepID=A0AAW1RFV5_9CHLO
MINRFVTIYCSAGGPADLGFALAQSMVMTPTCIREEDVDIDDPCDSRPDPSTLAQAWTARCAQQSVLCVGTVEAVLHTMHLFPGACADGMINIFARHTDKVVFTTAALKQCCPDPAASLTKDLLALYMTVHKRLNARLATSSRVEQGEMLSYWCWRGMVAALMPSLARLARSSGNAPALRERLRCSVAQLVPALLWAGMCVELSTSCAADILVASAPAACMVAALEWLASAELEADAEDMLGVVLPRLAFLAHSLPPLGSALLHAGAIGAAARLASCPAELLAALLALPEATKVCAAAALAPRPMPLALAGAEAPVRAAAALRDLSSLRSSEAIRMELPIGGCCYDECLELSGVSERGLKLLTCGGCLVAKYCSGACQQRAWRAWHKQPCKECLAKHG